MDYAVRQHLDESWDIFEDGEKIDARLDDDELEARLEEIISDGDLDAGATILVVTPQGRTRRAVSMLLDAEARARIGYVIGAQPINGQQAR